MLLTGVNREPGKPKSDHSPFRETRQVAKTRLATPSACRMCLLSTSGVTFVRSACYDWPSLHHPPHPLHPHSSPPTSAALHLGRAEVCSPYCRPGLHIGELRDVPHHMYYKANTFWLCFVPLYRRATAVT